MDVFYALLLVAVIIIIILVIFYVFRISRSRPIGSACAGNADCNAGLVCDNTLRVCRAPIGTQCSSDNDCTNNAACISGACALRVTPITNTPTVNTGANTPVSSNAPMLQPIIFNYDDSETSTTCESSSTSAYLTRDYSSSSKSLLSDYSPRDYSSNDYSRKETFSPTEHSSSDHSSLPNTYSFPTSDRSRKRTFSPSEQFSPTVTEISPDSNVRYTYSSRKQPQSRSGQLSALFGDQQLKSRESKGMTHHLLDIVEYKDEELMLLKTGEILYNNNKYKNNVSLSRLEVTQEKVFALSRGSLLQLETSSLSESVLSWKKVKDAPLNILHTSSTRDGMCLWLQLKNEGYLLDRQGKVIETVPIPNQQFVRNYGQDADHYIDSYPEQNRVVVFLGEQELAKTDCAYAIFDHDVDGMVTCSVADWELFSDIRLTGKSSYLIAR